MSENSDSRGGGSRDAIMWRVAVAGAILSVGCVAVLGGAAMALASLLMN